MYSFAPVIARSAARKQSSRFDQLRVPSLSRDWIAILRRETAMEDRQPGFAGLAMTIKG